MNEEITNFTFQGDPLDIVQRDGEIWVSVARVCEALALNLNGQRAKLKGKAWAKTAFIAVGRERQGGSAPIFLIHVDSLPMWLATIESSRVAEDVRAKLEKYQTECARVLADHFLGKRGAPSQSVVASAVILQQQAATLRDVPSMRAEVRKQIGLAALVQKCRFARVEGALRKAFSVTGYTRLAVANYHAALALIAPMTDKVFLLAAPPSSARRRGRLLRLVDPRQTKLPLE